MAEGSIQFIAAPNQLLIVSEQAWIVGVEL